MNNRQIKLLIHPVFLISLFLLLLNDISLKYEYGNWLTGKLSDFSGLLVFSLFLIALLPISKLRLLAATAVLFIWWKSPLSSGFILCWNKYSFFQLSRVIDYTDLSALLVLPVAYFTRAKEHIRSTRPQPVLLGLICAVTFFSFCFTSMPRYLMNSDYEKDFVQFYEEFKSKKTEEELLQKLASKNIVFYRDSIDTIRYGFPGAEYLVRAGKNDDSTFNWIRVENKEDSVLYLRKPVSPYYVIPYYRVDQDEIRNLKFTVTSNKRSIKVYISTFRSANYVKDKSRKRLEYLKHFRELFR